MAKKPWSECNKPYCLAMQFLKACKTPIFANKRLTVDFFKVYNFFKKVPVETLNLFHEYLCAYPDNALTMRELFYKAPEWNQSKRMAVVVETKKDDYLELLKSWK